MLSDWKWFARYGDTILFVTEPIREIDKHIPIANATSPNSNHFCNNELEATQIDSPPIPKIIRPKIIKGNDLIVTPYATIIWPINVKHIKIKQHTSGPYLSTKTPPKKGNITFGNEYAVYSILKLYSYSFIDKWLKNKINSILKSLVDLKNLKEFIIVNVYFSELMCTLESKTCDKMLRMP